MSQLAVKANELHEQAVADFKVSERFAYSFIMKVKQIRDDRLYKELGFSSFETYCESAWNVRRDYMDERILLADSFGSDFDGTCRQLGHKKSLLLARMEPEVRKQVETTIDVNESTVRQLKEAQKRAEEAERRAAQAEATAVTEKSTAQHYEKLWNQAKNQPAKVVTEQVQVVPHDYEDLKRQAVTAQQLNSEVVQLKRANTEIRNEYEEKLSQQQKDDSAKKNLQKYLSEHLRSVTVNHDSAIFNFMEIQGNREAHDIVMRFLSQYEAIIKKQFSEWEQLTSLRAIK